MSAERLTEERSDSTEPDLSLAIPCYNEEDVVRSTVERLATAFRAKGIELELVLVDNGSSDTTSVVLDQLIEEGLPVVKLTIEVNEGYGNGVLRGLESCRGRFVGLIPADGQVDAEDVVKVYMMAAQSNTPKLVKVRRRFRMDGMSRKVVSVIYNATTTLMFGGLGSIDINGCPKIMPRDYMERMQLWSRDWFLDAEIMIKAKRLKLEVLEFNVLAQMREGGSSNVGADTCWEFVLNLLRFRFGRGDSNLIQQEGLDDGRSG